MKINYILKLMSLICFQTHFAQTNELINSAAFEIQDITSNKVTDLLNSKLKNSQFIFIGEQHGIKEVTDISNQIYNVAKKFNYNILCIETDAIAAKIITQFHDSKDPTKTARESFIDFPYAIPFYNNSDDYTLFENVLKNNGAIWGIDQTFMLQFRLNFHHLIANTKSKKLRLKLEELIEEANAAYKKAIQDKDYMAPYIFKYSKELHDELIALTDNETDKDVLTKLKKTKEIYEYNFSKQYYLNNYTRAQHMKQNFMVYYNEARKTTEQPKVIFKLGSNHTTRGLTRTKVFDIGNLASEIAQMNNKVSLNINIMAINGEMSLGNPFAPVASIPIDDSKYFPEEIKTVSKDINSKYYILDMEKLRPNYGKFSKEMQDWMFQYDVLVLIKDAMPLKSF